MGLVASMGMTDNMLLKSYQKGKGAFVNRKPAREMAEGLIKQLDIVTPGTETPVRLLSGGNVQKVLLGREIESAPSVLITAYPVRGLDINSSYTIYDLLNEQKKKNVAVMYIGKIWMYFWNYQTGLWFYVMGKSQELWIRREPQRKKSV